MFIKNKKQKLRLLSSFVLPMSIFLLCLLASHVYPFGTYNSFISDADGYYINYISYWRRVLNGQESLFYSFTKGLGGNTSGLVAYHLLNPFMLLFSFFDIGSFPFLYTIVILLSIATCGLTMYLLLDDLFYNHGSNLIFSTSYALIGYNVVNSWQLQWLTGVMLFPLVVLGIRKILRKKSTIFYAVTLALTLISNFYIGYMCTIGAILIFLALFFLCQNKSKKIFFDFILGTALGGLLSSFVWLPALLSLRGGRASASTLMTFSFTENGKLLAIGSKLFTGMHSIHELQNGLPAIFCGIIPLALCILFFIDKENDKRTKAVVAILFGIYILSFYVNTLSAIFQGFSYTVWFNYRYSFIFSFLMICTAAAEFQKFKRWERRKITALSAIIILFAVLVFSENLEFADKPYFLIDLGILVLFLGSWNLYLKSPQNKQKIFVEIALLCACLNLYANTVITNQEVKDWFTSYPDTKSGIETKKTLVDYITNKDPSFYRLESEITRTGSIAMDPMMFDYNGTSMAGSVEKDFVKKGMAKFGIQWFDNRNYYDTGISASMDSLLGIKYVISTRDLAAEKQYSLMDTFMGMDVYQNPYTLSPVILSDCSVADVRVDDTNDVFTIQNRIWSSIVNNFRPLYSEEKNIRYTSHNPESTISIDSGNNEADTSSDSLSAKGLNNVWKQLQLGSVFTDQSDTEEVSEDNYYVRVEFTASYTGPYYMYTYGYVDGSTGSAYNTLQYLGNYRKGEHVTSKILLNATITESVLKATLQNTYIACLDMDLLKQYSKEINAQDISVEKSPNDDSHIAGTYISQGEKNLFFTIPYDEGWTLYIDGEKTSLVKTADLFMSADIPAGSHTYELVFFPVGLKAGIIISCCAVVILLAVWWGSRQRRS